MSDPGSRGTPRIRLKTPEDPRAKRDVGPPFKRLNAGWLALDFVNTVSGWLPDAEPDGRGDWGDRVAEERLADYADLVEWSRLGGVLDEPTAGVFAATAKQHPRKATAVLQRARALRVALLRLFRAQIDDREPQQADMATITAELRRLTHGVVLAPAPRGFATEWWSSEVDLQALLWPPLQSALALLSNPDLLSRLGRCEGAGCGWLYVDVGRGRSRRWCDTRDCGNVAKVRAHRRRALDG